MVYVPLIAVEKIQTLLDCSSLTLICKFAFKDLINHAPHSIESVRSPLTTGIHLNIYMEFDHPSSLSCSHEWQQQGIFKTNFRTHLSKRERQRTVCSWCKINTRSLLKMFQAELNIHEEAKENSNTDFLTKNAWDREICCHP